MKNIIKLFFVLFFFLGFKYESNAQIYDIVFGDDLKEDAREIISQMFEGMDKLVNDAIDRGDFITESRLKEAGLMLDGIKNFIHNERIETINSLDIQRLNTLKGLDQMMAGNIPSIYEINDLSAILTANTQDIANSLGGIINTRDKFGIYRINGISQEYKETGLYRVNFIGNVFGKKDIQNTVIIDGIERVLHQGTNINNMYVEFPSSEINAKFKGTEVSRIPINIIGVRIKKNIFGTKRDTLVSFKNTILLHPKYPIQYELVEISKNFEWSEALVGNVKEMFTVPNQKTTISTNVPDGLRIDSLKTRFYDPSNAIEIFNSKECPKIQLEKEAEEFNKKMELQERAMWRLSGNNSISLPKRTVNFNCDSWKTDNLNEIGYWCDKPIYFNEQTAVRRTFYTSKRQKIWIEIFYNKKIPCQPIEISRKLKNDNNGYLSYGVYESDYFSSDYASYRLKVKYFYDNWRIINPTSATTIKGIRTDMEVGAIKRLTINISSLTGF
ncbi:hypothetical protein [Mangrovibacterium diazotrophicum]|uniref:Uncharacterized protein n=1 Tax=Mangrovibacterium diazotrophicum TaxID=1261403 RepID=A0A419W4T9_9BACT|nr:hypothetical protein [Mangrovibacterium diazotrophicum]RKD90462.1 hypothetical protein BC643_0802 [Mangrovibacterium diazotrophicum]